MQCKEDLENWYVNSDPWNYKTTQDDFLRKEKILEILPIKYQRAIDIGCGEGFITQDIPAEEIHGIELSDLAASRLPWNVKRVHEPEGFYDFVMTTGTLYTQYNHEQMVSWIQRCSCRHILIAGIKDWLLPYSFGKVVKEIEFNYRQYAQKVTLYEIGT